MINFQEVPIEMIVAMDENGGIGNQGKLPWARNAKDFKHFKEITEGNIVIMGSRTYEEIEEINNARATPCPTLLSNRTCVVLSERNILSKSQITVEKSLLAAIQLYNVNDGKKVFIIGGLQIYTEALPWISKIHATVFKQEYICDKYLPLKYICRNFNIIEGTQDEELSFITLQRVQG